MADEAQPLTDEERAELEALRAEKAARLEREQAERERAELEELRAERAQAAVKTATPVRGRADDAAEDRRIREARERGEKLMMPDDDLRMPMGQKIVLATIAVLIILAVIMHLAVR